MQIVIPMSGFGERFRRAGYTVPKPLIDVSGTSMITHVVRLFPGEQDFLFICNQDHLADPTLRMRETLTAIAPQSRVIGIPPHRKGPVYAVAQAFDAIRDDEPVIVNYCDFACYWDYAHFRRFVSETGCAGAIPAYKGFHPHSLGPGSYAYVLEAGGWGSAIQEKQPFTDKPMEEYASSGTYYFASGAIMKHACRETITRGIETNGEHYVSHAYVPLFEEGRPIAVYNLQHFMQWGTPDDLAEYLQHDRAFRLLASRERCRRAHHPGALLVPMAGAGSRFKAEGYELPKPLVPVSGQPMAIAAAADLPATDRYVFVPRRYPPHVSNIEGALRVRYPSCRIVMLDALTEGQAVTCLRALSEVDLAAPLTIGACDSGSLYDADKFSKLLVDPKVDVIVWGFRGHAAARVKPASYGWIDVEDRKVRGVAVKAALRDPATDPVVIGTFTFKRASDFAAAAEHMMARNARVNGEYYIDTCINDAVSLGLNVALFEVDAYLCWGTPDELKTFEYWQSCFHKWECHPYSLSRDARVPLDRIDWLERRYAPERPRLPTDKPHSLELMR